MTSPVLLLTLALAPLAAGQEIRVEKLDSSYRVAAAKTSGFFHTGQKADLMLSGVEDALQGLPDVILGARELEDRISETGQDKLFWPGAVSFDGRYLWVGEFKFSGRVLRFSPSP